MLEDPARGVLYVPISKTLFDEMKEWSEPVQFKLERDGKGGFDLIFSPGRDEAGGAQHGANCVNEPRTSGRGTEFPGSDLVKSYYEMNPEQRLAFDAGYMFAERKANEREDRLRAISRWSLEQLRGWWRGDQRDTGSPIMALAELDRMEKELDA